MDKIPEQSSGQLVTQLSKSYLDTNLEKTGQALEAVGVTSYLKDEGILEGVDKEGVKTILASFATFYLLYQAKKHWKKVVPTVGVLALLIYITKKPKSEAVAVKLEDKKGTAFGIRG